MIPESVEVKLTVAQQVQDAVAALGLSGGKSWRIAFCEDVTAAVNPRTPLLDLGVVLRVRQKSGHKGDSTVKLRPCRWSQLDGGFLANRDTADGDYKIEADWAGTRHGLAASFTSDWDDDRLQRVEAGELPASALFSEPQADFLRLCAAGRVSLATITLLPALAAVRWDPSRVTVAGVDLEVRAERWTIPGSVDFLELSVVGTGARDAVRKQAAVEQLAADHALEVDRSEENKTQRVLAALIAGSSTEP